LSAAVLTLAESARIMRDALKDRSYRATPLGHEVARYYRWKKNEWGATKDTMRDYEAILARLALFFADLQLADLEPPVGTERLRECHDYHWGERTARTRNKVRSVWVDFFDWAVRERGLHGNPARPLARARTRDSKRDPFGEQLVTRIIEAQTYPADRLICELILRYALRRGELAGLLLQHFDFERRRVVVTGKGERVRYVPIVDDHFWRDLEAFKLEHGLTDQHALVYRQDTRKLRDGTVEVRRDHTRPATGKLVHLRWHDCLTRAGYQDSAGRGMNMHRGRHTVATEILRRTGNIVAAQKMLGHQDVKTTVDSYARFDDADLARVLREMREQEA
jgi:integrase/recombinase XerD